MKNNSQVYALKSNIGLDGEDEVLSEKEWHKKFGYINITNSKFFVPATQNEMVVT